jgi:hypothetical protein
LLTGLAGSSLGRLGRGDVSKPPSNVCTAAPNARHFGSAGCYVVRGRRIREPVFSRYCDETKGTLARIHAKSPTASAKRKNAMCDKCVEIDKKIARYRRILLSIGDQVTADRTKELITDLEAQKAALHPEQSD